MPLFLSLGRDCYFVENGAVPSRCGIVACAEGPDSVDLATDAEKKVDDAVTALSITESVRYRASLLAYSIDSPPAQFMPRKSDVYRQSAYGRRPPLTTEGGDRVKLWYQLLRSARPNLDKNLRSARALEAVVEGITDNSKMSGIHLYRGIEEISKCFGGWEKAGQTLGLPSKFYRPVERARRVVAHALNEDTVPNKSQLEMATETLPDARQTSLTVLEAFLKHVSGTNED